mgnify:CR=1 FL=1
MALKDNLSSIGPHQCQKAEARQRWTDGRYGCDRPDGHDGLCGSWSRSAAGRQRFEGFNPCRHMKDGMKNCDCDLSIAQKSISRKCPECNGRYLRLAVVDEEGIVELLEPVSGEGCYLCLDCNYQDDEKVPKALSKIQNMGVGI